MTRTRFLLGVFCLAIGLAACALPPVPMVETSDLPRRAWIPKGEVKSVILAIHGFNDYSNAFDGFAEFATAHGIAVHAYDQQGFGANRNAGRWPGTDRLTADLRREIKRLRELYPSRPLHLLGESMGGAVAVTAASGRPPLPVDGLILSAPAVWGGDQMSALYRATLWIMSHIAPGMELTGEGLDIWPSDNIDMLRAFSADPLVVKATRVDAIKGLVDLMDKALDRADALNQPLLVLIGEHDQIVPSEAFDELRRRLQADDCTEVTYPEGYHMLLRDLQRQVVWNDIVAWIDGKAAPSGLAASCGDFSATAAAASR